MGFLSASTGLTRYRLPDDVGDDVLAEIPRRLKSFAFVDIDQSMEERSFGWVCFDDLLDVDWATAGPEKGPYLAFSLRLDTRRVPPAVFKKHWMIALRERQAQLAQEGKKFVPKDQKTELREQVRQKLLMRSLPIPAVFDVVWSVRDNRVYLATTNGKIRTLFEDLFARTFQAELEPLTPVSLGLEMLGAGAEGRLTSFEGSIFIPAREAAQ
ncbi:Putative exonuclease, RdgC [Desulfonatronum thiosulfatophilum]|uniref:Putative exonuclease, RdgC n=1 Tax=Desulfonatronum thiosulfatophilum TaxID=617002 RepID=A0A1G6E2P5_9BACT|nr:recombination-associated protein RdgC [Desulfonatronum thiosulfatophilum]SDB51719.1 Putative exonuclease, RdgC [Desulfonatronum thiosulfatophilum]